MAVPKLQVPEGYGSSGAGSGAEGITGENSVDQMDGAFGGAGASGSAALGSVHGGSVNGAGGRGGAGGSLQGSRRGSLIGGGWTSASAACADPRCGDPNCPSASSGTEGDALTEEILAGAEHKMPFPVAGSKEHSPRDRSKRNGSVTMSGTESEKVSVSMTLSKNKAAFTKDTPELKDAQAHRPNSGGAGSKDKSGSDPLTIDELSSILNLPGSGSRPASRPGSKEKVQDNDNSNANNHAAGEGSTSYSFVDKNALAITGLGDIPEGSEDGGETASPALSPVSRGDVDHSDLYANLEHAATDEQCETLYYTPINEVGFGKDPEFIIAHGSSALGSYLKDRLGANSKARPLKLSGGSHDEKTSAGGDRKGSVASSVLTLLDGEEMPSDEKEMERLKQKILKKQSEIDKVEQQLGDKKAVEDVEQTVLALKDLSRSSSSEGDGALTKEERATAWKKSSSLTRSCCHICYDDGILLPSLADGMHSQIDKLQQMGAKVLIKRPCGNGKDKCNGTYCTDCLGCHAATMVETSLYACPFLKCPGCNDRIKTQLWRSVVSPEVWTRYYQSAESLLTYRCPECDGVGSLLVDHPGFPL